jgi:hypothetical protein
VREGNDELRQSFGTIADLYDRFRPGPPEDAVRRALPPDTLASPLHAFPAREVVRNVKVPVL